MANIRTRRIAAPLDRRGARGMPRTNPRRVAHDQLRDAPDGIYRGRQPSDVDMRQPNERDEAADGKQATNPDPVIERGEADLAAGRVDTDERGAAVENFDRHRDQSDDGSKG